MLPTAHVIASPRPLSSSPRAPLGQLTHGQRSPCDFFGKSPKIEPRPSLSALAATRTPQGTLIPRSKLGSSTPGELSDGTVASSASGIGISSDNASPADLLGALGAVSLAAHASKRATVFVPEKDRYSVGGTALEGYEGFGGGRSSTGAPPPPGRSSTASVTSLVPASTRALMLEERLKEFEAKNRALIDANAKLRRMPQMTINAPAPPRAEVAAPSVRHPCFGKLVADLGHKQSARLQPQRVPPVSHIPLFLTPPLVWVSQSTSPRPARLSTRCPSGPSSAHATRVGSTR